MTPNVVLVSGVGSRLGGNLAARLAADPEVERVLGVDITPPPQDVQRTLGRTEFVHADIRSPAIARVISSARVDTVVHAATTVNPPGPARRAVIKEMNVVGTMRLLAACQRVQTVRRLVVKSTAAVYGAGPRASAVCAEEHPPGDLASGGYARDGVDVESYVRGFARRRPDVAVTVLRLANLIGSTLDTVLTRYFSMPVVPTVLGFDPRVQLLHSQDALAVLTRAATRDLPGVYNVGGDGVLTLMQAIRRARRMPLPLPRSAIPTAARILGGARRVDFSPDQLRYLQHGRVVDTTRLRTMFGYTPRWTTAAALDDYVTGSGSRPTLADDLLAGVERRLLRGGGHR
jgi:UDP-glucose 4-epimerase